MKYPYLGFSSTLMNLMQKISGIHFTFPTPNPVSTIIRVVVLRTFRVALDLDLVLALSSIISRRYRCLLTSQHRATKTAILSECSFLRSSNSEQPIFSQRSIQPPAIFVSAINATVSSAAPALLPSPASFPTSILG